MTINIDKEFTSAILALIEKFSNYEKPLTAAPAAKSPVEMLTIKECTEVIKGLSEYTVRKLVAQGKIPHIRAGQGKRGKILVNKDILIDLFKNSV